MYAYGVALIDHKIALQSQSPRRVAAFGEPASASVEARVPARE
ncbi:hypothetical protein BN2364_3750 [Alloalcanivorax xenomutans]|nr:hypothetical protein BN2364_3750 [Alloalcanivorax xenomutans]